MERTRDTSIWELHGHHSDDQGCWSGLDKVRPEARRRNLTRPVSSAYGASQVPRGAELRLKPGSHPRHSLRITLPLAALAALTAWAPLSFCPTCLSPVCPLWLRVNLTFPRAFWKFPSPACFLCCGCLKYLPSPRLPSFVTLPSALLGHHGARSGLVAVADLSADTQLPFALKLLVSLVFPGLHTALATLTLPDPQLTQILQPLGACLLSLSFPLFFLSVPCPQVLACNVAV